MAKPLVWAHRGASGYAPENTLIAFAKAVEMGADGLELDIQLSKDGEIVVIHDEKIDRTSDGEGWVKDMTLAELKSYNYNKTHPEYEHADIPTMREVFELIAPTNLTINIELKTGIIFYENIVSKVLELTKEFGMEDRVIYSSFNHYTVMEVKEKDPSAKTGFLYADGPLDMPEYGKKHGVDALHPALYNLQFENFVKEAHEKGLAINSWTINEEEHILMAKNLGIDAVITNYPDKAIELLK